MARKSSVRISVLLVLSATAVLGLALVVIIPPWQSPDEPTHFEYVYVLSRGDPPWAPRPDPGLQGRIIVSLDRHGYWGYVGVDRPAVLPGTFREAPFLSAAPTQVGKNPPLYYFLASLVLRISPGRSLEAALYRLRLFSLFFSLLTVILVASCATEVFGRSSPLVPAAAAAAFLPQFLVIGTSVSPDPAINFIGAGVIYLTIRFQKRGFTVPRVAALLLCLLLGLLVNYKALVLLAALPGVAAIRFLFHRGDALSPGRLAVRTASILLALLAGYSALVWYFPGVARVFIVRLNILCAVFADYLRGRTDFPPGYWPWFHSELFKSFWLKYGWLKFELPGAAYPALKAASAVSLLGVVIFLVKSAAGRGRDRPGRPEAVVTLLWLAGAALGAYYAFWGLKGASTTTQGRHLFVVLPAWAILFVLGWSSLFPARRVRLVGYGLAGAFFLLAVASILFSILPAFS